MKRLLVFLLTLSLVLSMLPAFHVLAEPGGTIGVTVHYYRADGNYQNTDVWVGNFGDVPARTNKTWTAADGWMRTEFALAGVQDGEYIAFQLMNDSVWQNDLRYIDPWGDDFGAPGQMPANIEIWLVDGDLRAYSAPIPVDGRFVTARDGVRYMAIQGIFPSLVPNHAPNTAAPRGRDVFTFHISSEVIPVASTAASHVGRRLDADGNRAFDATRPVGEQSIPHHVITIYRDAVRTIDEYGLATGTAGGQADWFEIMPELGTMMVNFSSQLYQNQYAAGPYSAGQGSFLPNPNPSLTINNATTVGRHFYNGEVNPAFVPIDVFYENSGPRDGFTFMSLGSLERIMATVVPKAFGAEVHLLPTIFVAYDTVTDVTDDQALQEAAGFTSDGLAMVDDWIRLHNDASDGMPFGMSITRYGKMVLNSVHGDALKYDPSDTSRGMTLPHDRRVPATKDTLFDLASNSKVYGAVYAMQILASEGRLDLNKRLNEMPGWENMTDAHFFAGRDVRNLGTFGGSTDIGTGRDTMTIRQVLSHFARFAPDPEFMDPHRSGDLFFQWDDALPRAENIQKLVDVIVLTPINNNGVGSGSTYSDVGFMIAAILVEQITGQPLDEFIHDVYGKMGLSHTWYNPLRNGFTENDAVTTEMVGNTRDGWRSFGYLDDGVTPAFMRDYPLRGEVHDEKSFYLLQGAGGSAGLFSTTGDMASLTQLAQNGGVYNGHMIFDRSVHDSFRMPLGGATNTTFGIGWRVQNRSTSMYAMLGTASHYYTYGHQGWTGTMSTIDPVNGMSTVSLASAYGPNIAVSTASAHNSFLNRQYPYNASGAYHGPGAYVSQNVFAYGALRTFDTAIREWTVNFELRGGSAANASAIVRDGNFVPDVNAVHPALEFEGWYTDPALTQLWDLNGGRVMDNMTLYAKWGDSGLMPPPGNRVEFVAGGDVVAVQIVASGASTSEIAFPGIDARAARKGYRFDGWYADENFANPFSFSTAITADRTVYAKMTPVFTVTFDTDGGSFIWPQYVAAGELVARPPHQPRKFGAAGLTLYDSLILDTSQRFDGWFADPAGTTPFDFSAQVTADVTAYAAWTNRWTVMPVYVGMVPSLSTTQANLDAMTSVGFAVLDGQKAPPIPPPTVIPAGFAFEGWYYDLSLNVPYSQDNPIWTNTVLYPKFTADIEVVDIAIPEPEPGVEPVRAIRATAGTGVTVDEITGYIATVEWFDAANQPVTGTFADGGYYAVVTLTSTGLSGSRVGVNGNSSGPMPTALTPKELYRWNPDAPPAITINGVLVDDPADMAISGGHATGNVLTFRLGGPQEPPPGPTAGVTGAKARQIDLPAEFYLWLEAYELEHVNYMELEFTVCSNLHYAGIEGLEAKFGFSPIALDGAVGGIVWTRLPDGGHRGLLRLGLLDGGAIGINGMIDDIVKLSFEAFDLGDATMALERFTLFATPPGGRDVVYEAEITGGFARTEIVKTPPVYSIYDLNRDGFVNGSDLAIALRAISWTADSPGWNDYVIALNRYNNPITPAMIDVSQGGAGDGVINMLDIIDMLRNFT